MSGQTYKCMCDIYMMAFTKQHTPSFERFFGFLITNPGHILHEYMVFMSLS